MEIMAAALNVANLPIQELKSEDKLVVYPDSLEAISMFNRLITQFKEVPVVGMGLDYSSVQFLFTMVKPADPLALMSDLQIMERAWINAASE